MKFLFTCMSLVLVKTRRTMVKTRAWTSNIRPSNRWPTRRKSLLLQVHFETYHYERTCVNCILLLTATPPPAPAASKPVGSLDGLSKTRVTGWACDADKPTEALKVRVYIGSTLYTEAVANTARPDLKSVAACGGSTAHGISITMFQLLYLFICHHSICLFGCKPQAIRLSSQDQRSCHRTQPRRKLSKWLQSTSDQTPAPTTPHSVKSKVYWSAATHQHPPRSRAARQAAVARRRRLVHRHLRLTRVRKALLVVDATLINAKV